MIVDAASLLFREEGGSLAAVAPEDYGHRFEGIWSDNIGFRLNAPSRQSMKVRVDQELRDVRIGTDLDAGGSRASSLQGADGGFVVVDRGWPHLVSLDRWTGTVGAAAGDGAILAPMPGKVTSVEVAAGDAVTKGQRLLTLEAMKMEHGLVAPFDGVVAELNAVAGAQVQVDAVLVRIEKSEP